MEDNNIIYPRHLPPSVERWFERANATRPKTHGIAKHKKVTNRSKERNSRFLAAHLSRFCKEDKRYAFLREESAELSSAGFLDSAMIHRLDREPRPVLAFSSGDGATMSLTNIVPETESSISLAVYNSFVSEFVCHFKSWSKKTSLGLVIKETSDQISLREIIPGNKTRNAFEAYLAQHPRSHHFHDVRRLDKFTCSLHKWCRGQINVADVKQYLIQVLRWSEEDAAWCCQRIVIGLEVLDAYSGK